MCGVATISRDGKRWRVQIRRRGEKPVCASFETKARAQAWATQTEAEILAGKRGEFPNKTLADALDKYLAEESIKKAGLRWEKIRIEAFKRSTMASKRTSSITSYQGHEKDVGGGWGSGFLPDRMRQNRRLLMMSTAPGSHSAPSHFDLRAVSIQSAIAWQSRRSASVMIGGPWWATPYSSVVIVISPWEERDSGAR